MSGGEMWSDREWWKREEEETRLFSLDSFVAMRSQLLWLAAAWKPSLPIKSIQPHTTALCFSSSGAAFVLRCNRCRKRLRHTAQKNTVAARNLEKHGSTTEPKPWILHAEIYRGNCMAPGVKYKHKDFYPSYVKVLIFCDAYRQFFGRVCTKKMWKFYFY